jgi:hypothetical protein
LNFAKHYNNQDAKMEKFSELEDKRQKAVVEDSDELIECN